MSTVDPATGLPVDLLPYAPDTSVYLEMIERDGPPAWLDELDLRPGEPFVHMGTHAAPATSWLLADDAREMELALRRRLFAERRDVVFACHPSAEAAARELLGDVVAWLDDRGLPYDPPDPDEHPLAAAGRLVQDDLCLMIHRDGGWHFDGGSVCFPSVWRMADRIGQPTVTVHERVPHYDTVTDRVDRFFDRLQPGRAVWRRNWSFKPYPHLHVPTAKTELPAGGHHVAADGAPYWLRSERQTLRRLPDSGAIVFAIRVQLAPAGVLRRRPDVARALGALYRSWDEPMRTFKFAGSDLFVGFVDWLDAVGASSP
jgi:dimethylamine monooxygenase subunit A